jgi:Phosphate-induced protein 1 conserved region
MKRITASLAVSAGLLALAACADSGSKVTSPDLNPSLSVGSQLSDGSELNNGALESNGRHIMPTKSQALAALAAAGLGGHGGSGGTGISYHGGPVLQSGTNVVAVYWAGSPIYSGGPAAGGTGGGSQDGSLVGYFLRNLGGSSYFNINHTYTDGSGTAIVNAVNYAGYWANNANVPSDNQNVSDTQMIAMLQSGFTSGNIKYDPSTLYAIFTSGTVNLGGGFGTQYCAYHTHGTVTIAGQSRTVLYAAMPYDYAYPSGCTNGTAAPNGDPAADAEVNVLAHETEETTTDMMGSAWFDRRGYENADKCAWNWGTTSTVGGGVWNITVGTNHFLVQQNWINTGSGGCRQGY